jgi:5-formyltetrahydrofolate cyclo-ligase
MEQVVPGAQDDVVPCAQDDVVLRAQDDKAALRSRLRSARSDRDLAELDRAGVGLARAGLVRCRGLSSVAAYAAVGDEPPTRPLLEALVEAGVAVWLPLVRPAGLAWGRYDGWAALRERHGLLEPAGDPDPRIAIGELDAVLAPALAVDRLGNRLGRGAGYYDRALVDVRRDRIVAVVFAGEVLDVVPAEAHDVQVGAALTPDGLVELPRPDADL